MSKIFANNSINIEGDFVETICEELNVIKYIKMADIENIFIDKLDELWSVFIATTDSNVYQVCKCIDLDDAKDEAKCLCRMIRERR